MLLSGDAAEFGNAEDPKRCTRDGNGDIILQGDRCAADYPATGTCADSFQLGAKFAASGTIIKETCP